MGKPDCIAGRRDWSEAELAAIVGPFVGECLDIVEEATVRAKQFGKKIAEPPVEYGSEAKELFDISEAMDLLDVLAPFQQAWKYLIIRALLDSGEFNTLPHLGGVISRHEFGITVVKNEECLSSGFRLLIGYALSYGIELGRRDGTRTSPALNLARRNFKEEMQNLQSNLELFFKSMVGISWTAYIDMKKQVK